MQETSTATATRLVQTAIEIDARWIHQRRHLVVKTAAKRGGKFLNHAAPRRAVALGSVAPR